MPRVPIDFAKTIIYKIVCNDLKITDCYVGHTINFMRRQQGHKNTCANEKLRNYNFKVYKTIRENGGWTNWCMITIEEYPCKDFFEASVRERYYYEQLNSNLNMISPQRFEKEYRDMTKEKRSGYRKSDKYREQNKVCRNRLFVCDCGLEINYSSKLRHLKTKMHNDSMLCKNVTPVSV
jgi:hypothetical protein